MKTEHSIAKSLLLCFFMLYTLDTKSSQAAPSNWILDNSKYNLFSKPNQRRKIVRRARSLNGETTASSPIEPRIRDLPWYEEMERPCFPGDTHLNPHNNFSWVMTDHLRDEEVLSIAGEESIARSYFSRAESRLAHLSQVGLIGIIIEKCISKLSTGLHKLLKCLCLYLSLEKTLFRRCKLRHCAFPVFGRFSMSYREFGQHA